jgi:type III pantothenate kinase
MLILDIGNSKTKIARFVQDGIAERFLYDTEELLNASFLSAKVLAHAGNDGIAYSCVVPPVTTLMDSLCQEMEIASFDVKSAGDLIVKVNYRIEELGGDRLADAVAAFRRYDPPVLAVDFGTATTYNIVRRDGTFDGGAIAPGIKTCIDFLIHRSGLLPDIPLRITEGVAGHTSEEALVSGFYYTFTGQFKGISDQVAKHLGTAYETIGTGGMVDFAKKVFPHIIVDRDLTLFGIKMLYEENRDK